MFMVQTVCANMFNLEAGEESDDGSCFTPCVGNAAEACGGLVRGIEPLSSVYQKNDGFCIQIRGQNGFANGNWRLIYWYK